MPWFYLWLGPLALTLCLTGCAMCDREEGCEFPVLDVSIPIN